MRNFTRCDSAGGNASLERSVPTRKFRQVSLDSGIDEEVFVKSTIDLDLDYDMSEDEDEDCAEDDM